MSRFELSPFQKEKLQYYFRFFEPNEENVLEAHSVERLMRRILKYTGWEADSARTHHCNEIHEAFFEILFEKAVEEGGKQGFATLDDWYHIWSHILPGCKGMSNFPVWLRLVPQILFNVIDRKGDDVIDEEELYRFYKEMLNASVPDTDLEKWSKVAYDSMTDFGRYPLNLGSYEQIFANFLIGRTPHGPGKYIFGCFEHEHESFQLIQMAKGSDEDEDESAESEGQSRKPRKFGVNFN